MKKIILDVFCIICCLAFAVPKATGQVEDNLQKLLLYLSGDDLHQSQQLTVTLSNAMEIPVYADITAYDEARLLLTNIPIIIETGKYTVMDENAFPVMERLLVIESEYEVSGYIYLGSSLVRESWTIKPVFSRYM